MSKKQKPLILIVDDDSSIRTLLKLAIKNKGYQVEEATTGEECLAVYKRCQPDLILLDAVMPVMDGFTCCQNLCAIARDNNQEIPILMLTFLDDQESIGRAFEAGATDYITKPIHWAVLFQRVKRLLTYAENTVYTQKISEQLKQLQAYEGLFRELLGADAQIDRDLLEKVRYFFDVDRVICYEINNKSSVQSFAENLTAVQGEELENITLLRDYHSQYQKGQVIAINQIDQVKADEEAIALLTQLEIKSLAIAPLIKRKQILGLIGLYQSKKARNWLELELKRLTDLTKLLALNVE